MESPQDGTEPPSSREGSGTELDFRQLVELASDPIIVHDGTAIVYANAAAAALVGAPTPGAIVGKPLLAFVAPEYRPSVTARAQELTARGGAGGSADRVFIRLDGSRVEVETTAVALGDGRTLVHVRDVSRTLRAERAQRTAESRLRAFFEMSGEAIGLSCQGRHVAVNPAHARLFGYAHPSEVVGVPVVDLIAPSERARISALAARRAAGEPLLGPYLTKGLRRDGTEFELEIRATGFQDGGEPWTAAVLRDVTEQRAAERRLQESERRFRELFDLLPISLFELDGSGLRDVVDRLRGEGVVDLRAHLAAHPEAAAELMAGLRIVDVNARSLAQVGAASREELLANPGRVFVPESLPAYCELAAQLAGGSTVARVEHWSTTVSGERRLIETAATLLPGSETSWGRIIDASSDITERWKAEEARRGAELQLRTFFEMSGDAIGLARNGLYVFVNRALATLFGYRDPSELIGKPVSAVVATSERERVVDFMRQRVQGTGAPTQYETLGLRADGSEFALEVRASRCDVEGGALAMAILRDVTELRAAERKLQESERRFRDFFEFVPVSLWEVDGTRVRAELDRLRAAGVTELRAYQEGHPELAAELMKRFSVVAVNAFGRAMAGAKSMEDLLANLDKVHTPDTHARYRELGLQLAEGQPIAHAEGWTGTLDGGRRWVDAKATVIPGHEADWGRLLFASTDLTERREAEELRTALQERLRQAEKLEAVGRLAGGVAHDFNNILSGILGYAELTAIELDPASDLHDHQQRIREAALRARDLVRQILAFGRRDRSAKRIIDVPAVVREALALMKAGVPSSATLEARIDPEAGAALIDPTQLHQVVLNLCANARDAIGTYGHIEVAVDAVTQRREQHGLKPGRYVRLRVRDDGVGIDDATRARLFEPFMTTKGPSAGHGLGLAVAHGIVTGADGAILVESEPGKGSTFDVYLPLCERQEAIAPAAPLRAKGKGERILLVDDEPMVLGAHRRLLESLGYSVQIAPDGEKALAMFRASPRDFDLILTDQTMPRLSGVDLAREILALRPDARIVLCTGYSDRVGDESASGLGLRGVLAKPIDRETLAAAIAQALGG